MRLPFAALVLATTFAAPAGGAAPIPGKALATYCSPSGDVCFGVFRRDGTVFLDVTTFARYFTRYRLCVDGPIGREVCKSFPIRKRGENYASSVRWNTNFPREGPGRYRVTWKLQARLGPTLSFRLS